jgi:hypothetical protein
MQERGIYSAALRRIHPSALILQPSPFQLACSTLRATGKVNLGLKGNDAWLRDCRFGGVLRNKFRAPAEL